MMWMLLTCGWLLLAVDVTRGGAPRYDAATRTHQLRRERLPRDQLFDQRGEKPEHRDSPVHELRAYAVHREQQHRVGAQELVQDTVSSRAGPRRGGFRGGGDRVLTLDLGPVVLGESLGPARR